jgi:UDP:flavonoid glycosyltransferase YjiC (YdhE family)
MGMGHAGFVRAGTTAMIELLRDHGVDVVVDFWNPFAAIAARALGLPLVTVIQADAHPASDGFIWWRRPPADIPSPVRTINVIMGELGLAPIASFADLSVGDLTLVVGTPLTDPLPPGAQVTYIGPTVWQSPGAELPPWVDRLGRGRPLVWVYSGNPSYGGASRSDGPLDSAVVVRATVEALADTALDVVLTTGHHRLPKGLRALPANVHHAGYLPGLALAERSDLLIHHGGHGSCQTGLLAGTPSVIIPTYAERESNARRIESLGAGRIVPVDGRGGHKRVDVDLLRRTVLEVLDDHTMLEAARGVGRHLAAHGGPSRAADLIASFAAVTGAPARSS